MRNITYIDKFGEVSVRLSSRLIVSNRVKISDMSIGNSRINRSIFPIFCVPSLSPCRTTKKPKKGNFPICLSKSRNFVWSWCSIIISKVVIWYLDNHWMICCLSTKKCCPSSSSRSSTPNRIDIHICCWNSRDIAILISCCINNRIEVYKRNVIILKSWTWCYGILNRIIRRVWLIFPPRNCSTISSYTCSHISSEPKFEVWRYSSWRSSKKCIVINRLDISERKSIIIDTNVVYISFPILCKCSRTSSICINSDK